MSSPKPKKVKRGSPLSASEERDRKTPRRGDSDHDGKEDSSSASEERSLPVPSSDPAAVSVGVGEELSSSSTDLTEENARYRRAMDEMAEEYVCPITTELPVDPVMAEDGRIYDRCAIESFIRIATTAEGAAAAAAAGGAADPSSAGGGVAAGSASSPGRLRSPVTGRPMGPALLPAVQVRNAVSALVRSGAVEGDRADRYRERVRDMARVSDLRRRAESEDDTDAMYTLGMSYAYGTLGLARDPSRAFGWYRRAAGRGCVRSMACAGACLCFGDGGVPSNYVYGVHLLSRAAQGGSDVAAYQMGLLFKTGWNGLPRDAEQAKYWFGRVLDGSCEYRHLKGEIRDKVTQCLAELRGDGDAEDEAVGRG